MGHNMLLQRASAIYMAICISLAVYGSLAVIGFAVGMLAMQPNGPSALYATVITGTTKVWLVTCQMQAVLWDMMLALASCRDPKAYVEGNNNIVHARSMMSVQEVVQQHLLQATVNSYCHLPELLDLPLLFAVHAQKTWVLLRS